MPQGLDYLTTKRSANPDLITERSRTNTRRIPNAVQRFEARAPRLSTKLKH